MENKTLINIDDISSVYVRKEFVETSYIYLSYKPKKTILFGLITTEEERLEGWYDSYDYLITEHTKLPGHIKVYPDRLNGKYARKASIMYTLRNKYQYTEYFETDSDMQTKVDELMSLPNIRFTIINYV